MKYVSENDAHRMAEKMGRAWTEAGELAERGVISEAEVNTAAHALWTMAKAASPHGDSTDRYRVREILRAARRKVPPNWKRFALVKFLETKPSWSVETRLALREFDPAFKTVRKVDFEREARVPSSHQFAANLSCRCRAFGDHDAARSLNAFENAAREMSRTKTRSRAKR